MPQPKARQYELSKEERAELAQRIEKDWVSDSIDMQERNSQYQKWYRLWRAKANEPEFRDEDTSNFHIPLTEWNILAKVAKEVDALLGEDSEIVVRPVGPSDAEQAPKISRYMNWRVKQSLKLFPKLYEHLLQKNILGTSIVFVPWITRERTVRKLVVNRKPVKKTVIDEATGLPAIVDDVEVTRTTREETVIDFEGPDVIVENIEDWAIPPSARSIEDANRFERRLLLTVDELLDMADEDKLDSDILKGENLKKLRNLAETGSVQNPEGDAGQKVRDEKREDSSLPKEQEVQGRDERLVVINWFGKWRSKDAEPDERAQELVGFWQPDTKLLLGVSRLVDLFPDGRAPFVRSQSIKDLNNFWGRGMAELLESINKEMDVQHNALTDAGVYALGPLIVYEPSSGFNPAGFKYEPWMTLPVADANKVKALNLSNINMAPFVALQPSLLGYAERVTGLTEPELGRQFAQPNAPRTLGQQQMIQAGSTVRLLLDLRLERESLRDLLHRIWDLDKRFLPKPVFFRVTESEDFEQLTEEEMMGDYDFDIGPLTSTANKQQEIGFLLQAYALNLQNPIAAQNPALLAGYLRKINTKLGQEELNALIPDLSKMAPPRTAEEENVLLLEGRDVDPHPQDNHIEHIAKHTDLRNRVEGFSQQYPAFLPASNKANILGNIDSHIAEHQQAQKTGSINFGGIMGMGRPMMQGAGAGGGQPAMPSDTTGQPNSPLNALKGALNIGGLNIG